MASIRLTRFGGLRASVTDRNLRADDATVAHNTELRDGSLRPFRTPEKVKQSDAPIKTIHMPMDANGCCGEMLCFDTCVSVTSPLDPGCDGFGLVVVWPEDGSDYYRMDPCTGETWPLVVPKPETQPGLSRVGGAQVSPSGHVGPDERAYTYTWVDRFGVESPPAPPTPAVESWDRDTWLITGIEAPPPNAVCMRIYRTSSKFISGQETSVFDTAFLLVDEVEPATSFTDDRCLEELEFDTLLTRDECPPPPCLQQVQETQEGYTVGWVGSEIYFSERNEPHNWPEKYRLSFPEKIRGIAVNNDVVYVATTGHPYIIRTGPAVDQLLDEADLRLDVSPYDQNYPAIGRETMVTTGSGASYASTKGMVSLRPSLPATLESRTRLDEDLWRKYFPNRVAWQNGQLFGSRAPNGAGTLTDIRVESEGPRDFGDFVTIDLNSEELHSGRDGYLYFVEDDCVFRWDTGAGLMTYRWRSATFTMPGRTAFRAMKIVGDFGPPVTVRVFKDGALWFERLVRSNTPFRLCHNGKGVDWAIELEGTATIHEVHMATSIRALTERASSQ